MDVSVIIPNFLYLGSAKFANNLDHLRAMKITHIVNLAGKRPFEDNSEFSYLKLHLTHSDDDLISKLFEIEKFIDDAKKSSTTKKETRVLVHCLAGINRSASIVVGYIALKNPDWSLKKSLEFVQSKRKIKPANALLNQLEQMLNKAKESKNKFENENQQTKAPILTNINEKEEIGKKEIENGKEEEQEEEQTKTNKKN